jgi:hypothetical protein
MSRASSAGARHAGDARPVQAGAAQRLDEGLVGQQRLLLAGGVEDRAVAVGRPREHLGQPRLADAGLAAHEDEPSAARTRGPPGGVEHLELTPARDEGRALAGRELAGEGDGGRPAVAPGRAAGALGRPASPASRR